MNHRGPDISDDFLAQLKDDLVCRRVERGMSALEKRQHQWSSIDPHQQNIGVFLGYLALWVDIGFQRPATVKSILAQIPASQRAQLCLRDYVFVRMAEAMVAMAEQAPEQAIPHLDFVLAIAEEIGDSELLSVANFWKGRCLRKKADYEQALVFTTRGRDIALSLGHKPMAAVMRVLESWLFFQKGKLDESTRILKEAEAVLNKTDDYLTLGNIHSAHGRIARQQARYQHAIEHFDTAIAEYRKRDLQHRNVARTLANLAYVKRLIALQLRRKIDSDVAQRQKAAGGAGSKNHSSRVQYRRRFEELREEAFSALREAAAIYEQYPDYHGIGTVHLNCGYLYLDNGDLDNADVEAAKAFALGEQKKDYIIMARARVLLCMIENARVEEEIGEGTDSGIHARLAQDCIQEAIELVKHTQDRRLMGDAYIWLGLTYCNSFFADIDSAREAYDFAQTITKGEYSENSREDMQTLKSRLVRKGNVDPILRAWSQGSIGDKTFQQITEEFAEIIIPKIYEREGRKVSRVAKRLSISPKKVRRILSHVGRQRPSK
jgi:tetratricopeptide (TPR) repeat protein